MFATKVDRGMECGITWVVGLGLVEVQGGGNERRFAILRGSEETSYAGYRISYQSLKELYAAVRNAARSPRCGISGSHSDFLPDKRCRRLPHVPNCQIHRSSNSKYAKI